jgi:hypothetical protein
MTEPLTPLGRVWCLALDEPIVSFAEYYLEEVPWRRLWSSYVVLPEPWPFLHPSMGTRMARSD